MNQLHFEGVLEKHGKRFFEGFRKRWFILDGSELTYYKAPEHTEENYLGSIDMSMVRSVNPVKAVTNGFQIVTRTRTYTFSATSSDLMTDWVSVLRQAMQLQSFENRRTRTASKTKDSCQDAEGKSPMSRRDSETDDLDGMYESVANVKKASDSKLEKKSALKKSTSADSSILKPKKQVLMKSFSDVTSQEKPAAKEDPKGFYDFASEPVNKVPAYEFVAPPVDTSANDKEQKPPAPADYDTIADPSFTKVTQSLKVSSEDLDTYHLVNSPSTREEPVADYDVVGVVIPKAENPSEVDKAEDDLYDVVGDTSVNENTATKNLSSEAAVKLDEMHNNSNERAGLREDVLYSMPMRKEKILPSMVTISEEIRNENSSLSPAPSIVSKGGSSQGECTPLPPPRGALYAIEELKMFFCDSADEQVKMKREEMDGSNENVFNGQPGTAFQELKNLLARLETGQA